MLFEIVFYRLDCSFLFYLGLVTDNFTPRLHYFEYQISYCQWRPGAFYRLLFQRFTTFCSTTSESLTGGATHLETMKVWLLQLETDARAGY